MCTVIKFKNSREQQLSVQPDTSLVSHPAPAMPLLHPCPPCRAQDIINVELPRAVPLVYYLDENLRPIDLAGSAPYLRGEYVGDPEEVSHCGFLERLSLIHI